MQIYQNLYQVDTCLKWTNFLDPQLLPSVPDPRSCIGSLSALGPVHQTSWRNQSVGLLRRVAVVRFRQILLQLSAVFLTKVYKDQYPIISVHINIKDMFIDYFFCKGNEHFNENLSKSFKHAICVYLKFHLSAYCKSLIQPQVLIVNFKIQHGG